MVTILILCCVLFSIATKGPTGIDVDSANNLFVGDRGNNRVLIFGNRTVYYDAVLGSWTNSSESLVGVAQNSTVTVPLNGLWSLDVSFCFFLFGKVALMCGKSREV
jgi:hypothetical protein